MSLIISHIQAIPLGPLDAGMPLTLDEFDEAEFEMGYRYELIHGVLVVTPPPLEEERDSNEELRALASKISRVSSRRHGAGPHTSQTEHPHADAEQAVRSSRLDGIGAPAADTWAGSHP
jgi:hypothetical protein